MKCPLFRSGLGARCLPGGRHELLPDGRRGADDEDPRSDFASDGEEDYVRHCVEKPKGRLFPSASKSRPPRGIPTFPQPRRRSLNLKPDISCTPKSRHSNLLTTSVSRD